MSVLHSFLCFLITSKAVGPAQKNIQWIEPDDGIVDGDDNDDIPVCTKYVMSFVQNTSTISLYIKSHIDYWIIHIKGICVFLAFT